MSELAERQRLVDRLLKPEPHVADPDRPQLLGQLAPRQGEHLLAKQEAPRRRGQRRPYLILCCVTVADPDQTIGQAHELWEASEFRLRVLHIMLIERKLWKPRGEARKPDAAASRPVEVLSGHRDVAAALTVGLAQLAAFAVEDDAAGDGVAAS